MKCPKCGYHSFDHLDSCKKCGQGLIEHKERFNLRGFFFPGQKATTSPDSALGESNAKEQPVSDGSVNFGFDFLDEEGDPVEKPTDGSSLDDDNQTVNIDQTFSIDGETIPEVVRDKDSDDKPGKGPEFAF
ncbi:MAG: hypothetical protein IH613_06070 [Desulfuromonadales bacterium]|nr:hypothetical protein [Desulfuromonadales bacterium]